MSKLIAEGYRRLFKGKRFYITMIVMMAITAFIPVLSAIVEHDRELRGYADPILFIFSGQIPMFVSIAAGLLITQDFRNNTARNKIIIGHSRTNIYLANLIVSLTVMLIYVVVYYLTGIATGFMFMGFKYFPETDTFIKMTLLLPIMVAFTSMIVFICNSIRSTGGFVLALGMHYVVSTIEPFLYMINGKIYDKLEPIVPSFQISILQSGLVNNIPEKWPIMLLSCVGITLVSTALGVFAFNKSDLK